MVVLRGIRRYLLVWTLLVAILSWTTASSERAGRAKRTIGGQQFSRGTWPWLVLLRATIVTQRLFGFPISHYHLYCGGALISPRWVLTAAHCFTEDGEAASRPWNWEARMAASRLRPSIGQRMLNLVGEALNNNDMRQWEIDVDRIIIHPQYNVSSVFKNDIALVRLSSSVPSGFSMIQSVSLPDEWMVNFPEDGQTCITKGWGCTSNGGGLSHRARQVELPIYPARDCGYIYSMLSMDNRICAGYRNAGVGVCRGDSGSPLVCFDGDEYKLVGVVSFTSRHRPESFPAVFTKVQDYLPWMRTVMENE